MKYLDVNCNHDTRQATIRVCRINKQTGAYQNNRYSLKSGDASEKRLMRVINEHSTRTEWQNNQYNNHAEIVRIYFDAR